MPGKQFKNLGLEDTITVEIRVADALMACAEYMATEWAAPAANNVFSKIFEQMADPRFVKETEAAYQQQQDMDSILKQIFTGQRPDFPPNMEET